MPYAGYAGALAARYSSGFFVPLQLAVQQIIWNANVSIRDKTTLKTENSAAPRATYSYLTIRNGMYGRKMYKKQTRPVYLFTIPNVIILIIASSCSSSVCGRASGAFSPTSFCACACAGLWCCRASGWSFCFALCSDRSLPHWSLRHDSS